jgi:hypothetical protein
VLAAPAAAAADILAARVRQVAEFVVGGSFMLAAEVRYPISVFKDR